MGILRKKIVYLSVSLFIVLLGSSLCFYFIKHKLDSRTPSVDISELMNSIQNSKLYLTNHILPSGRAVYRTMIDNKNYTTTKYNILRHAGTIYSMYLYDHYIEKDYFKSLRISMVDYLIKNYIVSYKDSFVVVSNPDEEGEDFEKVKLGALGLTLIGIASLYEDDIGYKESFIKDKTKHKKILSGLANFISFLQKPDGSFFSSFDYEEKEVDENFISLYYPGEACLGLLFLYNVDKNIEWFNLAKKSLLYLSESRKTKKYDVPFDHWVLIATEKLLFYSDLLSEEEKEKLIYHAMQIAFSIIPRQIRTSKFSGSFINNNKPCSIGTIVEGLVEAYKIFRKNIDVFNKIKSNFLDKTVSIEEILTTIKYSVNYLIRVQVKEGDLIGGIPSRGNWLDDPTPKARTIQIDNVQHVFSGWINYYQVYKDFLNSDNNELDK